MNLTALINECENRTAFNDSRYRSTWRTFINESIREFARRHPWPGLEDDMSMVLPSGQRFLVFPHFIEDVLDIHDMTNHAHIDRDGEFGRNSPRIFSQGTTGKPVMYDSVGDVAALADPTGYVYMQSGDASDTDIAYVTGLIAVSGASGTPLAWAEKTESVTANGTAAVTLTNQFVRINSICRATNTSGDYFFYDAGDSNKHVSFIPAGGTDARFRRIQFMRIPSAQTLLRVRFRHRIPPIVNDDQGVPPAVDEDFLIQYTIAQYQREKEQYQKAELHERKAANTVQARAHKEQNYGEAHSQIEPYLPQAGDVDDDNWRGGW
jgi:hypothetical protein